MGLDPVNVTPKSDPAFGPRLRVMTVHGRWSSAYEVWTHGGGDEGEGTMERGRVPYVYASVTPGFESRELANTSRLRVWPMACPPCATTFELPRLRTRRRSTHDSLSSFRQATLSQDHGSGSSWHGFAAFSSGILHECKDARTQTVGGAARGYASLIASFS